MAKHTVCMLLDNGLIYDNRVKREAAALQYAGYEVHVICLSDDPAMQSPLPEHEMLESGAQVHRLLRYKYVFYTSWLKNLKYAWAVVKAIKSVCSFPTVIHVHDANLLPYAWLAAKLTRAKLVFDSHEHWAAMATSHYHDIMNDPTLSSSERTRDSRHWERLSWVHQQFLPQADAVISVSPSICKVLQQQTKRAVVLVRNTPPHVAQSFATDKPRRFHDYFELPTDMHVLLFQGVIDPTRGLHTVAQAMNHLVDMPVCLVLMGKVPPAYQAYVNDLQAQAPPGRVLYKAGVYSAEFLQWTASADVGLVAALNINDSYLYSLPNKLFEYVQCELPIVHSQLPDMTALVAQYGMGVGCDMTSPEAVAQAIRVLLTNPTEWEQCQQNVRRAKQELCWEHEQQSLTALYEKLLT